MKKILLSLLIALTLIGTASARDFRILTLGAKLGVNMSTVSGMPKLVGPMKPYVTGGFHFEFRPIKWVGLSAELLYTGSGFKTIPLNENGDVIDASYNFIDIPIMARIYLVKGLSINVGVQLSYLFTPTLNIGELRQQFSSDKIAFNIPVGLSYSFNFGLILEARYTFGLTNILPTYSYQTTGGRVELPDLKNGGLSFTVGWRIFSF